jgi:hypothetical protein
MGQNTTVAEDKVATTAGDSQGDDVIAPLPDIMDPAVEQTADTPGHDENGDGLAGGQATADVPGDILGI